MILLITFSQNITLVASLNNLNLEWRLNFSLSSKTTKDEIDKMVKNGLKGSVSDQDEEEKTFPLFREKDRLK